MTGAVHIDITDDEDQHHDRHRLAVLERCPDGARVRIDVGARWFVSPDACRWLHAHVERVHIEIVGTDPQTVQRFVDAARTGSDGFEGVA